MFEITDEKILSDKERKFFALQQYVKAADFYKEAFLDTAIKPESILRLAKAVGYKCSN